MPRFGRMWGRGSRRAAPSARSRAVLAFAVLGVFAGASWLGWWLLGSLAPADTLVQAYGFLERPVPLVSAQDASWRLSVRAGGGLASQTDALLSPGLPPALCLVAAEEAPSSEAEDAERGGINRLIRRLDQAVVAARWGDVDARLEELRSGADGTGDEAATLVRYNLARAYAAAEDHGPAARLLEGIGVADQDGADVPIVAAGTAARLLRSGGVERPRVTFAFHARYLSGLVAHARGRPEEAIAHFRRALNAVNYLVGSRAGLDRGGHYERTDILPGSLACGGSSGGTLTSLDAYAGLVAAYMAAPEFSDPTRLPREVRRRGYEIDPGDPLTPLIVHAQEVAGDRAASPIPENVFWASSNLQRVYHYNRLRPDARLAVARSVFTLRMLDDAVWTEALGLGEEEACDMLVEVARDLHRDEAVRGSAVVSPTRADSTWAAVAVHTFARLESECEVDEGLALERDIKGRWLRLGGDFLHAGLVARYEERRMSLEEEAGLAGTDEAAAVIDRVAGDRRFFESGRVPPDLAASVDPRLGAVFVRSWWEGVFRDVARGMVSEMESGTAPTRIRAGDAGRFLRTMDSAIDHAGLTPMDVYRPESVETLVRSQGLMGRMGHGARYWGRSFPLVAVGVLTLVGLAGLAVVGWAWVGWWRYVLLTRTHFYRTEAMERSGPTAGEPS